MEEYIRNPKQKRAIEKKEKIIDCGFDLICKNGYYNTNTKEIAEKAGVSTGIVYQYFKDKYDIFMAGLEKHGDEIFFPMLNTDTKNFKINKFEESLNFMLDKYIANHRLSETAHEEITAMIHSDKKIAEYYCKKELMMTEKIKDLLVSNGYKDVNLNEKVHLMIGLIDNLCHEVTYHKHNTIDYEAMKKIVISTISNLFKE